MRAGLAGEREEGVGQAGAAYFQSGQERIFGQQPAYHRFGLRGDDLQPAERERLERVHDTFTVGSHYSLSWSASGSFPRGSFDV